MSQTIIVEEEEELAMDSSGRLSSGNSNSTNTGSSAWATVRGIYSKAR